MFDNVVVGVGGSRMADAVALGRALCTGQATLVHVAPADASTVSRLGDEYLDALVGDARERATRSWGDGGARPEMLTVADPSPAHALQQVALWRHATLVVLGSAHHGAAGRLLAGDVGRGVLQAAPCPVAVAPRGFGARREELRRVAVGFDGSDEAFAALAVAGELARDLDATLVLHAAWDIPAMLFTGTSYTFDVGRMADEERERVTAIVDRVAADHPGIEVHVTRGSASHVLADATRDADLLVVGSRRWGPAHRIAMGSTSDQLVHHAACPVIVVPRPVGEAPSGTADHAAAEGSPAVTAR